MACHPNKEEHRPRHLQLHADPKIWNPSTGSQHVAGGVQGSHSRLSWKANRRRLVNLKPSTSGYPGGMTSWSLPPSSGSTWPHTAQSRTLTRRISKSIDPDRACQTQLVSPFLHESKSTALFCLFLGKRPAPGHGDLGSRAWHQERMSLRISQQDSHQNSDLNWNSAPQMVYVQCRQAELTRSRATRFHYLPSVLQRLRVRPVFRCVHVNIAGRMSVQTRTVIHVTPTTTSSVLRIRTPWLPGDQSASCSKPSCWLGNVYSLHQKGFLPECLVTWPTPCSYEELPLLRLPFLSSQSAATSYHLCFRTYSQRKPTFFLCLCFFLDSFSCFSLRFFSDLCFFDFRFPFDSFSSWPLSSFFSLRSVLAILSQQDALFLRTGPSPIQN